MIVADFINWYFLRTPKNILKAWENFLRFNLEYFSISLLLKTFFSHWRRYQWNYPRSFDLTKYVEIFFSNLISRVLGVIMRTILIIIGLLAEILIFLIGGLILIIWTIFPVLLIVFFI